MLSISKRLFGESIRLLGDSSFESARDSQAHFLFSVTLDTQRETSNETVLVFEKDSYNLIGSALSVNGKCEVRTYDASPANNFLVLALDNKGELEAEAIDNVAPETVWL
ncbi:hypothetical protein ACSLBF_10565 [Pseudoalteromonas sp. T1lg65]|uniref:hypothetical protein n=1 Tax=Pseudoalteromonas sp. T1lg65 TaxID=2077101 RepID=UPI003F7A0BE6